MAACVKGNKFDEALHLFSLMEDGPSDDTIAPRISLSSSASPSTSTSAETLSEPLASLSPPLVRDTYSYGTALNALGKKGMTWIVPCPSVRFLIHYSLQFVESVYLK